MNHCKPVGPVDYEKMSNHLNEMKNLKDEQEINNCFIKTLGNPCSFNNNDLNVQESLFALRRLIPSSIHFKLLLGWTKIDHKTWFEKCSDHAFETFLGHHCHHCCYADVNLFKKTRTYSCCGEKTNLPRCIFHAILIRY